MGQWPRTKCAHCPRVESTGACWRTSGFWTISILIRGGLAISSFAQNVCQPSKSRLALSACSNLNHQNPTEPPAKTFSILFLPLTRLNRFPLRVWILVCSVLAEREQFCCSSNRRMHYVWIERRRRRCQADSLLRVWALAIRCCLHWRCDLCVGMVQFVVNAGPVMCSCRGWSCCWCCSAIDWARKAEMWQQNIH